MKLPAWFCKRFNNKQKINPLFSEPIEKGIFMNAYALHKILYDKNGQAIDYRYLKVNPAWEEIVGIKSKDVLGKKLSEVLPGIEDDWVKHFNEVVETGKSKEFQQYSDKLGKHFNCYAYRTGKDEFAVLFKDITLQNKIDTKLNTLKNAVKQSPVGVLITDPNGVIEYINPKFTDITGFSIRDAVGNTPRILKSDYHDESFYEDMWETLLSGKTWKSEIRNKKKSGELYWERLSISPINEEITGELLGFVGMKEDITEYKKLQENLVKSKEKAEESDKLKTAFLASMSHEIRTPMNSIIGFTDLLREEDMPQEKRDKYTNHIQNSGNTLLNLIDDIIDIAKIEAGQMKISSGTCDLSELMDGLLKSHTEQKNKLGKEHIELIPNGDNVKEQLIIKTDQNRLTQILNNIISNAIKFTEEGYVKFGYLTVSDEILQFYIKDTGIGIPDDEIPYIFDRFRRVENDEKIYQGTGLGLAITKNLVELLGGNLWVESFEDVGSIFYFTLPYETISKKPKEKKRTKKKEVYNWEGKTILIAEDEKLNYTYLSEVLERTGATLIWAKTGSQAVNLYRKHKQKINVILMDIKMPKLSGYEAMEIIRKTDKEVPLIVQTAHVISGEKDKSFSAGADKYLTKPVKYDKLLTTLHKYISYEPTNKD